MSKISIQDLCKKFEGKPPTTAADHLGLEIEDGEFLVLLGPSGCGKTTTLRCLAGLEVPDQGRIKFGERVVYDAAARIDVPPDKRSIGMVFQSYALWPHMTVRRNIDYPLKARKLKQGIADGWVEETAKLVNCEALLDRYPGQLSGGQQQRIALARGLVARPDLVLFDEPLSNLDARLRDSVRSQIHELHQRLRFTAVFVTHDQSEALALGERLAIMRSGVIEQLDTPQRIFKQPGTEYVASFIGMNNRLVLEYGDGVWRCDGIAARGAALDVAGGLRWVAARLRSEDLRITSLHGAAQPGSITLRATVVDTEFAGRHYHVVVAVGSNRFQGWAPTEAGGGAPDFLVAGAQVNASFDVGSSVFYGQDGARAAGKVSLAVPQRECVTP